MTFNNSLNLPEETAKKLVKETPYVVRLKVDKGKNYKDKG